MENVVCKECREIRPCMEENIAKLKSHLYVSEAAIETLSRKLSKFKETEDAWDLTGCEEIAEGLNEVIFECVQVIWGCEKALLPLHEGE